ncbi:hypothetical protein [Methanolacinia petrolearia]|uniref:hypothetical protein n=1 Tax=Methanolacinia petrolearia TaxID=54120 RepID=UPI003BACF567
MPDTYTPNLGLTKPCTRKNWAEAVNENFEKLGVLHYIHIDGSLHICKNAVYQDGSWLQPDTSLRSSLIVMGSQGHFVFYTCPAGNPTISAWTPVATFGSDGSLALSSGSTIGSDGSLTLSSGSTIGSDGSLTLPGGICISNGSLTLPFGISANDGYLTLPGGISANNGSLILPGGASIGGALRCPTLATEEIYGLLGTVASASSNVRAEASYTETYELGTSITIPNHNNSKSLQFFAF